MSRVDAFGWETPTSAADRARVRKPTPQQVNLQLRNQGYADGRVKKKPTAEQKTNGVYMASYRRGVEEYERAQKEVGGG